MQFQEFRGYVIHKAPSASEKSISRISILTAAQGIILGLFRETKKSRASSSIDLFDLGEIVVKTRGSNQDTFFIQEFRLERRHSDISRNYEAFTYACSLSKLLYRNNLHPESTEDLFLLWEKSLQHLLNGYAPSVVYLKAIYLLVQQEGYPVKEAWLKQLPTKLRESTWALLKEQLHAKADREDPPEHQESIERLHKWIRKETAIII